jgi:nucleobase:cation symporter-1, NCS1 family
VVDLYKPGGRYWFSNGYNLRALLAVAVGVVPVIPGFLNAATTKGGVVADPTFLDQLYRYGVFVAFGLAAVSYFLLAQAATRERAAPAAQEG